MERQPFSLRFEVDRPPNGLFYDEMPDAVRVGIVNVLDSLQLDASDWGAVDKAIRLTTDSPPTPYTSSPTLLVDLLAKVPWSRVCDSCEAVYQLLDQRFDENLESEFQHKANHVFARNYFGYEMREGYIERVGAITHDAAIAEARGILSDPDLAGPNEQFNKAVRFYSQTPEPDCPNAVKEAVGAVEGFARILFNDKNLPLSQAVKKLPNQKGTHKILADMLDKLYGYRGDAEGASHGNVGIRPIPLEEAEFVLGVSANAIVFLARLFGRAVQ